MQVPVQERDVWGLDLYSLLKKSQASVAHSRGIVDRIAAGSAGQLMDPAQEEQIYGRSLGGPALAALREREKRIVLHGERIRSARNPDGIGGTRAALRVTTDDVVKARGDPMPCPLAAWSQPPPCLWLQDMPLPDFALDLRFLSALFVPRRPLKPSRREVRVTEPFPSRCDVVLTVQKCSHLPKRLLARKQLQQLQDANRRLLQASTTITMTSRWRLSLTRHFPPQVTSGLSGNVDGHGLSPAEEARRLLELEERALNPYVEVRFQGASIRTLSVSGSSPTFNEQLKIPFHPPGGDFAPISVRHGQHGQGRARCAWHSCVFMCACAGGPVP